MPARTANTTRTTTAIPAEIVEAATFAAELVNRTLKLVARGIAAEEQSPTPDVKKCSGYVATIKRAADALKALVPLRIAQPSANAIPPVTKPTAPPDSEPAAALTASADPIEHTIFPENLSDPPPAIPEPTPPAPSTSTARSVALSLASLSKLRGKSLRPQASTRHYGEHLSRR